MSSYPITPWCRQEWSIICCCRGLILEFDQKKDLAKLHIAKGASFDSHIEEHDARCLENTQVELQRYIAEWAKDKNSSPLFWLNGTGKSTTARFIARSFADRGQLGVSFFQERRK